MKTKLIHLLLFLLISSSGTSQNQVDGSVLDKSSKIAVPLARVIITTSDTIFQTDTDFEGNFSFEIRSTDSIKINVKGMAYHSFDTTIYNFQEISSLTIKISKDHLNQGHFILSSFNKHSALQDIKNDEVKLLLPGGIISSPRLAGDAKFEKKYNIKFLSQGCVRYPGENQTEYNQEIFKYLDEKYGSSWRKTIRNDVIGLPKGNIVDQ